MVINVWYGDGSGSPSSYEELVRCDTDECSHLFTFRIQDWDNNGSPDIVAHGKDVDDDNIVRVWYNDNVFPAPSNFIPTGLVAAFNLAICPTGWLPADGTNGTLDLRGQFIRGLNTFDGGTTVRNDGNQDPGEVRVLGANQEDTFQGHWHELNFQHNTTDYGVPAGPSGNLVTRISGPRNQAITIIPDGTNGTPRVSSESRPKNIALIYCAKN